MSEDLLRKAFEESLARYKQQSSDPAAAAAAMPEETEELESMEVKGVRTLEQILRDKGWVDTADSLPFGPIPVKEWESEHWGELVAGARFESEADFLGYRPDPHALSMLAIEKWLGGKALMVGLPGTGKTSLARFLGMLVGQPVCRINGDPSVEKADLIGERLLEGGATVWQDGTLTTALKAGYLVVEDEIFRNQPQTLLCQQNLFERGGFLRLLGKHDDDVVYPHEDTFIVATDNTKGVGDGADKFVSMVHDTSLMNRIECVIEVNYLQHSDEVRVLKDKHPKVDPASLDLLVKLANECRVGYMKGELSLVMSLRNEEVVCQRMPYIGMRPALKYGYCNSLPSDEQGKFAELYRKVTGDKW